MSTADPTLDRLQTYIRNYFPTLRSAERGQAIFWFALHYNRGSHTELWKAMQAFAFSGVPTLPAPERGDLAWEPYQMLSVTYAPHGRPQDPNKAEHSAKQAAPTVAAKRQARKRAVGRLWVIQNITQPHLFWSDHGEWVSTSYSLFTKADTKDLAVPKSGQLVELKTVEVPSC